MRFRLKNSDTIKASLYNSSGKLLTTIYDSGLAYPQTIVEAVNAKNNNTPDGSLSRVRFSAGVLKK